MIEISLVANAQPAGDSPGLKKGPSRLPDLAMHEIIHARVVRALGDRGAMIMIKDREVMARSSVPLETDQMLLLKVEKTSPAPFLRLLGIVGRSPGASFLLQAAHENPWQRALESLENTLNVRREQTLLRDLLRDLSVFFRKPTGEESLREWIDKSGLLWESKLKTLALKNGLTSEAFNRLVEGDTKGLLARLARKEEGQLPVIGRLLQVIEDLQWLNRESVCQSGKVFLLIPLVFSQSHWTVAQLLLQGEHGEARQGSGKGRRFRIVLLAELPGLGDMRAEMMVQAREVSIVFFTVNTEVAGRVREALPVLIRGFQDHGFTVGEARCEVRDRGSLRQSPVYELVDPGSHCFRTIA